MIVPAVLSIRLLSDTTFAGGGSRAGEVDIEIDHDELGLPRIRGKRIRSLLRDTWLSMSRHMPETLHDAAARVFGPPGDVLETSVLRIGTAELGESVRNFVHDATRRSSHPVDPLEILRTLTAVRAQTSEDRETGAPERASLRTIRVARHGLVFHAPLQWLESPTQIDLTCLALATLGTRHAGLGRNRGRGMIEILLHAPAEDPSISTAGGRTFTRTLARTEAA